MNGSQALAWADSGSLPTMPLVEGWQVASKTRYDGYGNAVFTWSAGDRCAAVQYDNEFQQLPMREAVYVGESTFNHELGERCGN